MEKQLKEFFKDLSFREKEHKYSIGGKDLNFSVSGLIKQYCPPFNTESISRGVAKSRGISQAQVIQEWDEIRIEACDRGHRVHVFGEFYPYDRTLKPKCKQEEAVAKFWEDLPDFLVPVVMELRMYHKEYMFAGTADILLYNTKTKKYIIADYKTNKDLFKNHKGQRLLEPFSHLLDMPFSKYTLQLSYYQILLEQAGIEVSHRKIVWVKPDGNYYLYDTEDITGILNYELKNTYVKT